MSDRKLASTSPVWTFTKVSQIILVLKWRSGLDFDANYGSMKLQGHTTIDYFLNVSHFMQKYGQQNQYLVVDDKVIISVAIH